MKFDTHLCLVSNQATPNLIPVMDANTAPRRVVLALSADMKQRGAWLSAVMRRHGITVEVLEIPDAYDFNSCWEVFSDWLTTQDKDVALNATGGTKIANEDKYIKDMREALVKAHREGDVDEIKDIHEIMKDKEGM